MPKRWVHRHNRWSYPQHEYLHSQWDVVYFRIWSYLTKNARFLFLRTYLHLKDNTLIDNFFFFLLISPEEFFFLFLLKNFGVNILVNTKNHIESTEMSKTNFLINKHADYINSIEQNRIKINKFNNKKTPCLSPSW